MSDTIRIPGRFIANTQSYRESNGWSANQLALQVLKAYEPPKTTVLFADEFKAKYNLSEAEYGVCCQMGKRGKYFYMGDEKYQYIKTVWYLYP